jgi:signal transduction histidine kinase
MGDLTAEQNECFGMATEGGEGLLAMINELLDISKMEDGSLPLNLVSVEPVSLVKRALHQVEHLAHENQLTLRQETEGTMPVLSADVEKLTRVLVNLCGNAIKFTPPGGSITVKVEAENISAGGDSKAATPHGRLLFSVTDTGEGIPADYFSRIFEKFGQVETRKSGRKMSTGLGLTFCKMVVEKHDGEIWVESEMGQGSRFSFYIPLS